MTTFEITITILLALIAFALIFIGKALDQITKNQESQYKKLDIISTQIANIWYVQDKIENNTAITASIIGKMYNTSKKEPRCKDEKIIQMSASDTAAMLQNMADIRREQELIKKGGQDDSDN